MNNVINNAPAIFDRLNTLELDDGFTLKNGEFITRKTGWQVATEGAECYTAEEALNAVIAYEGNCGVWVNPENGIYCVDKSHRVNTKAEAMEIGRACHQYSVLRWRDMKCIEVQ